MTSKFRKWTDLNQFHEVRRNLNYPRIHQCLKDNDNKITFGFKTKLHGTNAAVRIESDGKVVAQKRSGDALNGHFNFAQWVANNEPYFASLANSQATIYIFGEWCGPGVQAGVACSMTDDKFFYVFAVDTVTSQEDWIRTYEPDMIEKILGDRCPDHVITVPWHVHLWVDFDDRILLESAMATLNREVERIGEIDPLIKQLFNIEGPGEGLVGYPSLGQVKGCYLSGEEYFSWFNFKAKSEHHRVNKTKTAVEFDATKFASIQAFADFYVTEPRLLQALSEGVQNERLMIRTPDFISWVVQDIYKESTTEREANPELDWKACSKACSTRAVLWYKAKVQELV
jgi:hypothetical protein